MMKVVAPRFADIAAIDTAAEFIRQGRLVAFPTETVYGLGADASNPAAVRRIFEAKGRPADHPLIVHIPSSDCLADWAESVPESAYQLAGHFWPGPLALILKKKPEVLLEVTGGQTTVALRMPNHPVALQLLQIFGGGIAAPSANRYCRISPTTAQHVSEELGNAVDLILDGGACSVGVESTILDLSGAKPKLLRPGHITHTQIETVLQTQVLLPETYSTSEILNHSTPRAPGMMALHYAPETKALCCPTEVLGKLVKEMCALDKKTGLLVYHAQIPENAQTTVVTLPAEADAYAKGLYAALRRLDDLKLDVLLIERPPSTELWRAINDRLGKATVSY